MEVPARYRLLRLIAVFCQVVSFIILIVGIIIAIAFLGSGPGTGGLWFSGSNVTGVVILLFAIGAFIQLFVLGSFLILLINTEHTTRIDTQSIEEMLRRVKSS